MIEERQVTLTLRGYLSFKEITLVNILCNLLYSLS